MGSRFLWGVCTKGKNKPGFAWGCPRFTITGDDIGGRLWARWLKASKAAGSALQYAVVDDQGARVKPGKVADVVRFILDKNQVENPDHSQ